MIEDMLEFARKAQPVQMLTTVSYYSLRFTIGSSLMLVAMIATTAVAQMQAPMPPRLVSAQPPKLIEIVPAFGSAGEAYPLRVTIQGTGFTAADNTVDFGPVKIPNVPSTDGVRITVDVPKVVRSRSEVPPMVLTAGDYRVTVTTAAGQSNALMFTLRGAP